MLRQDEIRASDVFTKSDLRNTMAGLLLTIRSFGRRDEYTRGYVDGVLSVARSLGISISPSEVDFNRE